MTLLTSALRENYSDRATSLPVRKPDRLRQRLEYHDRLIRSRHHRLRDSDQATLLIEDAEAWCANFAAVQLRGGARRRFEAPRLNLRERDVELRSMAHAVLYDGKHAGTRKTWQQVFQTNQVVGEFSRPCGFRQFFELDGLIERKFSYR